MFLFLTFLCAAELKFQITSIKGNVGIGVQTPKTDPELKKYNKKIEQEFKKNLDETSENKLSIKYTIKKFANRLTINIELEYNKIKKRLVITKYHESVFIFNDESIAKDIAKKIIETLTLIERNK